MIDWTPKHKLIFFFHIWYEKNSQFNTSALKILKVPTYVEATKKIWATFPMLNFSRRTPTLGVCSKWDSRKVQKIAHFGVFRHIGGVRWGRNITDIKI